MTATDKSLTRGVKTMTSEFTVGITPEIVRTLHQNEKLDFTSSFYCGLPDTLISINHYRMRTFKTTINLVDMLPMIGHASLGWGVSCDCHFYFNLCLARQVKVHREAARVSS